VRRFFDQTGSATKHEIASTLAEWFIELAWKLPAKRKPWQSENYQMVIFDAVATGAAFLALKDAMKNVDGH
jgi:hypothetical protein